jgi:hypothetical protein
MEQKYNMSNTKKNTRNAGRNAANTNLSTEMATSLLDELRSLLVLDFSEETWATASHVVRDLSTCVSADVYSMIGNLWSEMYVKPSIDRLDAEIANIRASIEKENLLLAKI